MQLDPKEHFKEKDATEDIATGVEQKDSRQTPAHNVPARARVKVILQPLKVRGKALVVKRVVRVIKVMVVIRVDLRALIRVIIAL